MSAVHSIAAALGILAGWNPVAHTSFVGADAGVDTIPHLQRWSIAPLAAPGTAHPLGTVAVVGAVGRDTVAMEWDLDAAKEIRRKTLASDRTAAAVASASGHLFVASAKNDGKPAPVSLVEADDALDVKATWQLGTGILPSLDVSDKWVVAGFFEERSAFGPAAGSIGRLTLAMHVVVIDRTTGAIAGARVFLGKQLFLPSTDPKLSMHAIAIREDAVFLSLPGAAEVILESAELPALTPIATRTSDKIGWIASAPIRNVGRRLVVSTPNGWRIVGSDLADADESDATTDLLAWNAETKTLFVDDDGTAKIPWKTVHFAHDCDAFAWAWKHPVAICAVPSDDPDAATAPMRIYRGK